MPSESENLAVPLSLLTMVFATAERLLDATDVNVRALPHDRSGRRLEFALSDRGHPDAVIVAPLASTEAGIEVAVARPPGERRRPIPRAATAPVLRVRSVRHAARHRAAEVAFAMHDFRPRQLVRAGSWRFETSDHTWTRTIVLVEDDQDGASGSSYTFAVSFAPRAATVEDVMVLSRELSPSDGRPPDRDR